MLFRSPIIAITIFIPLLIAYLIYITIRLLFVYPVMTFEKKGAYNSLVEDFHFVKSHFSHTFLTWLIVLLVSIFSSIVKENVGALSNLLREQLFLMSALAVILIVFIELFVSVWEQVFIFKSYLSAKKRRRKRR